MTIRAIATSLFGFITAAIVTAFISANVRELARQRGWDTFLVRWWDALPNQWQDELRWERLRGLWLLWSIFGLTGGFALALWVTPFLSQGQPVHPDELPTGIRDHHHGSSMFKGLAGMSWGLAVPAPIYLYSVEDNIYATDFFARGENVSDKEIQLEDVFIQSVMTSRHLPLLIKVDNDWVPINTINPIPPHAEFDLSAVLDGSKGIPMTQFLKEWGAFAFVARYGGNEFKEQFDEQAVAARFSQLRPLPHVTKATR